MKEALTTIDLASAGEGLSDWARVAAMRDTDIERAIVDDADTFAATSRDLRLLAAARLPRLALAVERGRLRRWARPLRRSEERALAIR